MDFLKLTKKQTAYVFVLAYLISFIVGIISFYVFEALIDNVLLLTFVANLMMTIVIFAFSLLTKNSSMYDPYWSVIPPAIILWWIYSQAVMVDLTTILLIVGIMLWAIRLTYNWWKNWTGFKEQDWRYDLIKEKTTKYYLLSNFGAIHLIPTLVVYIQLINAYEVIIKGGSINIWIILGFILMLFATTIQFLADKQMYEFRQNRNSKSQIIDRGIWLYSRHPNYLGELSIWVGVYLMYLGISKTLDMNILYPLAMIALFLFVSIPMMERKLENRPGFNDYKKQVSMLIPYRKNKQK